MRIRILLAILLAFVALAALSASVAESFRTPAAVPALATSAPLPAADKAPQWLLTEVNRKLPSLPPETEAVVLLNEQNTVVNPKGVIVASGRRVIRVLRPGGAQNAARLTLVNSFDTTVRSMTGWVVNPDGGPRKMTMKQAIQTSMAPNTLYMDAKAFLLVMPEVDTGSIIGFEWEEERTPPSLEDIYEFQETFPVLRARYCLTLPSGWNADVHWINWKPLEASLDPAEPLTRTFDITDVPAIVDEPFKPNDRALAGRLLIRLMTPEANVRAFSGWSDMGAWYERLSEKQCVPDKTVSGKAQEVTAGAADTLSKIRALTEFVQREIRYVSIQIGIGGFQPHAAPSILLNRYGDCKDKATLLSAMLKALGVDSLSLIVNTERGVVTMESPVSMYSFNHVVLAIRLPADIPDANFDGIVRHPRLGRLLVFDPTSPITPLGRLPYYLQDNTALLVAGGGGELIGLPRAKPESNLLERKGKFVLTADGTLVGEIQEVRRGSPADSLRYRMQTSSEAERRKYLETFLSRSLASFTLRDYEIRNLESVMSDLVVSYRFTALNYAKRAGGLLVFRPRVLGVKAVDLASGQLGRRRYPIDLETTCLDQDEFLIELPEGCALEGLPKPAEINAGFAAYKSSTEVNGRTLVYRREYRLIEALLAAARFDEANQFYITVGADEQQSALLKTTGSRRP
ncbi:MAG: DUF3857 and transglutaminase domain-containing protein [Candidatus Aminicenantes bacterium]|nr:DUF3857 and transglutaminase domain-containing protein [Candidatus Aminicenantes bacterium]